MCMKRQFGGYCYPQKTNVNQKKYIDFLWTSLLPECRHLYPDNDFGVPNISSSCKAAPITPRQNNSTFSSKQHAHFHQLINTAFARFESVRLFSLGYLARTCLRIFSNSIITDFLLTLIVKEF